MSFTCWCSTPSNTPCTVLSSAAGLLRYRQALPRKADRNQGRKGNHLLVQRAIQHALHGAVLGLLRGSFWPRVLHRLHRLLRRLPRRLGLLPLLQFQRIFPGLT